MADPKVWRRSGMRMLREHWDKLAPAGNVRTVVPKLATQTLRVGASGGASIDDLQATTVRLEGSGALKAELGGVDEQLVSISGRARTRRAVARDNANVSVSSVAKVVVKVERRLRASSSGAGLIEYLGDRTVIEEVSGIGRVKRRDSSAVPGVRIAGRCAALHLRMRVDCLGVQRTPAAFRAMRRAPCS